MAEIYKLSENGMLKYLPNFETRDEIHNQWNEEMDGSDKNATIFKIAYDGNSNTIHFHLVQFLQGSQKSSVRS